MEEVINGILIREVETKNIMTKSSLPVGGYSVNPAGAFRSISTFPVSIHILYSDATEKRAVTDVGCTVA